MAVTQKQIADRLNISRSWVARALNGYDSVSPEMRARVQAAAAEMGYDLQANQGARSLAAQRYGVKLQNGLVAVLFPVLEAAAPQHLPFYRPLFEGMEKEASERGVDLCLCLKRPDEMPRMVRNRGVDGVIFMGFATAVCVEQAYDLPTVLFHSTAEGTHSVTPDDYEGTRLATQHLLDLGHRNIAFLGIRENGGLSLLRPQGYRDALTAAGVPVHDEWIEESLSLPKATGDDFCRGCETGCAACRGWQVLKARSGGGSRRPPFTAVVCHNDLIAMGLIYQAQNDGLNVPGDLSVTGFDDITPQYKFNPEVTSVACSNYDIGRCAVQLIYDEVLKNGVPNYTHKVFPVHLAVRQSTAAPLEQ